MMKKNQHLFNRFTEGIKPLMLFVLCILGCTSNPVFAQNWDEIIKIVASDRQAEDYFGYSVAISGDYAIIGATGEDHNAVGGGFRDRAGSAYIFKNIAGTWAQVQKIVASDRYSLDSFGNSVSISGDYAIVGASREDHDTIGGAFIEGAGAAYIFKNNDGIWTEVQKIVSSDRSVDDEFGFSVAISGDFVIVGAYYEDHDATGGAFLVDAGAAYIFKNNDGTWAEVQKIVASDRGVGDVFGHSVAISGDYAIVGAFREDHNALGGGFRERAGSAYIFKYNDGAWAEVQKLVASDREESDYFGWSVAISGEYAIVSASGEDHDTLGEGFLNGAGAAYIFKIIDGTWFEVQKIVASDRGDGDFFGVSVSISEDYALVTASQEDNDTTGGAYLNNSGAAYLFKNNAGTWSEVHKIVASDRGNLDHFGNSGAISGDYAIIGAIYDGHDTTGGTFVNLAGSAYIFKKSCATSGTDVQTACNSFTWIDGNTYIVSNDTATYILTNLAGCDSVVTLDLTINSVSDITTTLDGLTITANNTSATYQWLDCNDSYAEILGETNQDFTPAENGSYAVKLTEDGCLDTSACVIISTVGINASTKSNLFTVYPNPTSGQLTIEFENEFSNVQLTVRNVIGQTVFTKNYSTGNQINFTLEGAAGIYFIEVVDQDNLTQLKVIKE